MASTRENRLDSWKEIADYLGRDLSTVRRWESEKNLPVHRVPGGRRQAVFAYTSEIDKWLHNSTGHLDGNGQNSLEGYTASEAVSAITQEPAHVAKPDAAAASAPSPRPATAQVRQVTLKTAAAAAILAVLLGVGYSLRPTSAVPRVMSYAQITNDGFQKFPPLLTDDLRLYFSETVKGLTEIHAVPVTGGDASSLPVPLREFALRDLAADGSEFLFSGSLTGYLDTQLAVWSPSGGPGKEVQVLAHDAAWSRDTTRLAYAAGNDLFVARRDGADAHRLATFAGVAVWPRWSPDGKILRFTIKDQNSLQTSLWEMSADGANLHELLLGWNSPPAECCGSWTADGRYFVFQSTRGGRTNLWALREQQPFFRRANPEPIPLTKGSVNFSAPLPGRDGKRLFALGQRTGAEVVRYDLKTRQFSPIFPGIWGSLITFSRDGQWAVYVDGSDSTLWRCRADGSERLQLTLPPMIIYPARWSPDGKQIAFPGRMPGQPAKIYVVSSQGGQPREVMPGAINQGVPTWSPEGNSIVFGDLDTPPDKMRIHLLNLKTQQATILSGSEGLWSPRWSHDGRYISALTADSTKLLLFDLSSGKWSELCPMDDGIVEATWSRHSDYIYFDTGWHGGEPGIFRVRVADHKLERVASLAGLHRMDGWMGLDPDDSPILARDAGAEEVYALEVDWPL